MKFFLQQRVNILCLNIKTHFILPKKALIKSHFIGQIILNLFAKYTLKIKLNYIILTARK